MVGKTNNLDPMSLVTFDDVLVNLGDGWNTSNNEFVAPSTGEYFFIMSAGGWCKLSDYTCI